MFKEINQLKGIRSEHNFENEQILNSSKRYETYNRELDNDFLNDSHISHQSERISDYKKEVGESRVANLMSLKPAKMISSQNPKVLMNLATIKKPALLGSMNQSAALKGK